MRTSLIGLVGAGKSTALAALWFSVVDHSEHCTWYLSNSDRPSQSPHWNELRNRWLSGDELERTKHELSPEILKLKLTHRDTGETNEIVVPDIAGEDFEEIYTRGRFPRKHADLISGSDHIVLFVHVNEYKHPMRLSAPPEGKLEIQEENIAQDWAPDAMLDDSKNVAMLRGAVTFLKDDKDARLTVVLTAWDLVEGEDSVPDRIFKKRFPLLYQYVHSSFKVRIVAVSAQGFDYQTKNPDGLSNLDSVDRICVVDREVHHDITRVFT